MSLGTGTTLSGTSTTSLLYQNAPWVPVPIRGTGTGARVLPKNGSFHQFSPTIINISSSKLKALTSHHGIQLRQLQKWVGSRISPLPKLRLFPQIENHKKMRLGFDFLTLASSNHLFQVV